MRRCTGRNAMHNAQGAMHWWCVALKAVEKKKTLCGNAVQAEVSNEIQSFKFRTSSTILVV